MTLATGLPFPSNHTLGDCWSYPQSVFYTFVVSGSGGALLSQRVSKCPRADQTFLTISTTATQIPVPVADARPYTSDRVTPLYYPFRLSARWVCVPEQLRSSRCRKLGSIWKADGLVWPGSSSEGPLFTLCVCVCVCACVRVCVYVC